MGKLLRPCFAPNGKLVIVNTYNENEGPVIEEIGQKVGMYPKKRLAYIIQNVTKIINYDNVRKARLYERQEQLRKDLESFGKWQDDPEFPPRK